jgi:solute carrier family 25 folate transporter 32
MAATDDSSTPETATTDVQKRIQAFAPLVAGLCGGAASTVLLYPLDLIKVRLQVNEDPGTKSSSTSASPRTKTRLSSIHAFRVIIRHEGFLGLYQGLIPAVIGSAVSWGGYFFVYEGLKREYRQILSSSSRSAAPPTTLNSLENFTLACFAGASMVALTNPVWLIKTRMQLQMKQAAKKHHMTKPPYKGMLDAGRTIMREEGFWALYKGAGPALLLVSHGGVQFVVYEFLKRYFHYSRAQRDPEKQRQPVSERLQLSMGYLTIGAISKM